MFVIFLYCYKIVCYKIRIAISKNKFLSIRNNFYNPIFNTEYVFDKLQVRPTCIKMTLLWLSQLLDIYIRVELFIVMKKDNV